MVRGCNDIDHDSSHFELSNSSCGAPRTFVVGCPAYFSGMNLLFFFFFPSIDTNLSTLNYTYSQSGNDFIFIPL